MSPTEDMTPPAGSTTQRNGILLLPTPQADQTPLSPADLRTLKKIIDDVQSPSPSASTIQSEENDSLPDVDTAGEESSDTGCEDQVTYTKEQHEHGDEASDGYADEDKSMELSDGAVDQVEEAAQRQEQDIDGADELEYFWNDGDTIEDIIYMPGKTSPPARKQDLDLAGIHVHDQPTSEDNKSIKQQRAAIKEKLEAELLEHERWGSAAGGVVINLVTMGHENDAIDPSDDPKNSAIEAMQAEIGIGLEDIDPSTRRKTQLFSPKPASHRAIIDPISPTRTLDFSDSRPAVMQTPSGKHLDFTSHADISDTPFAKTLKYFKQQKDKENSLAKSRRNASLPEEIAELAREAHEEEEEDLEKYREMDLAPMEPVMENDFGADLITLGTPVKSGIFKTGTTPVLPGLSERAADGTEDSNDEMSDLVADPEAGAIGLLVDTRSSSPQAAHMTYSLFREHASDSDADINCSDDMSEPGDRQLILAPEYPTFVKVIGMLPAAMFWQVAAPIANYSNKAYDALVDKLHDLGL